MGNVLCRHKNSGVTGGVGHTTTTSSLRSPFDRIISRVQLCPSTLHHDNNHGKRNCNRYGTKTESVKQPIKEEVNNEKKIQNVQASEWQEANLEVPSSDRDRVKSIFADLIDPKTPVPPPRRHRHKKSDELYKNKEPIQEDPITKTIVEKHICKIDEERFYKQHMKHHSTVSLPNINELQLSLAKDIDNHEININESNNEIRNSNENKKIGKLENYMMRCRSFGSLLPNKLVDKLKFSRRINSETAESDDSWGGLEDWDLGVIEHYKPHDNSLPRPNNNKNKFMETLNIKPVPPVRKTDSLLKKFKSKENSENQENKENNMEKNKNQKNEEINKANEMLNKDNKSNLKVAETSTKTENLNLNNNEKNITDEKVFKPVICSEEFKKDYSEDNKQNTSCSTPPPTPDMDLSTIMSLTPPFSHIEPTNTSNDHSTLMNLITKIKAEESKNTNDEDTSDNASLTPSLNEFQVTLSNILEDSTTNNGSDKRKISSPQKNDSIQQV